MLDRLGIARSWTVERLEMLRQSLRGQGFDAFVVPRWDRHQSEYCAVEDERLAWMSGFSGTWGLGFVTMSRAALFVDGRYTVQAEEEVDPIISKFHLLEDRFEDWLQGNLPEGSRIGFDPAIVNPDLYDRLVAISNLSRFTLVPCMSDPFVRAWSDRPVPALARAFPYPVELAGETSASKRRRLQAALEAEAVDLLVETQLDNIAWLLNIRGADVPDNPYVQAFAIATREGGLDLFVDERKFGNDKSAYELEQVDLHATADFPAVLAQRIRETRPDGTIVSDNRFSPALAKIQAVEANRSFEGRTSPLTKLKSVKNGTELDGMRSAALRDSLAWIELLQWLESCVPARESMGDPITESEVEQKLTYIRRKFQEYVSPSFRTIAASGANGAMCHYNAPPEGGSPLGAAMLFLLDAGAQFMDGTTDTTRTICFGSPEPEWCRCYTLVLKGHIRLATIKFPVATKGYQIDAFAREALWDHGLDYDHGTGHGVGHFLSVHEHPQRIGKDPLAEPLLAGMTITNEPGYYQPGEFGIRIENLCEIIDAIDGFLQLRPMAFVPLARNLIDRTLLTAAEIQWVDRYHDETWRLLSGRVEETWVRDWLRQATQPLS